MPLRRGDGDAARTDRTTRAEAVEKGRRDAAVATLALVACGGGDDGSTASALDATGRAQALDACASCANRVNNTFDRLLQCVTLEGVRATSRPAGHRTACADTCSAAKRCDEVGCRRSSRRQALEHLRGRGARSAQAVTYAHERSVVRDAGDIGGVAAVGQRCAIAVDAGVARAVPVLDVPLDQARSPRPGDSLALLARRRPRARAIRGCRTGNTGSAAETATRRRAAGRPRTATPPA